MKIALAAHEYRNLNNHCCVGWNIQQRRLMKPKLDKL